MSPFMPPPITDAEKYGSFALSIVLGVLALIATVAALIGNQPRYTAVSVALCAMACTTVVIRTWRRVVGTSQECARIAWWAGRASASRTECDHCGQVLPATPAADLAEGGGVSA